MFAIYIHYTIFANVELILIEGQIEGLRTRQDGTIAVTIGTQELPPDIGAAVLSLNRRHIHALFKADPITDVEAMAVKELAKEWDTAKTPGARLRGILYRVWEQQPQGFTSFDAFYLHEMNRISEHYKSKLE